MWIFVVFRAKMVNDVLKFMASEEDAGGIAEKAGISARIMLKYQLKYGLIQTHEIEENIKNG